MVAECDVCAVSVSGGGSVGPGCITAQIRISFCVLVSHCVVQHQYFRSWDLRVEARLFVSGKHVMVQRPLLHSSSTLAEG